MWMGHEQPGFFTLNFFYDSFSSLCIQFYSYVAKEVFWYTDTEYCSLSSLCISNPSTSFADDIKFLRRTGHKKTLNVDMKL